MLGPLMYKYWESIATHWSGEFKKYLNPLRQFILGKHNVEVWGRVSGRVRSQEVRRNEFTNVQQP